MAQISFLTNGCIENLEQAHKQYLGGNLTDAQCWEIDKHLLVCQRCSNHWDALTKKLEETFPTQVRDAESA